MVEDIDVRPNGWLLPTTTTSSLLNQLNPTTGELYLVYDLSAGNGIAYNRGDLGLHAQCSYMQYNR